MAKEMAQSGRGDSERAGASGMRVLTDLSGQFDTVVMEFEVESLAAWEQQRKENFASPEFAESFQRTADLIESGRTEFYTIEG